MSKHGKDLERSWADRVPDRPRTVEERYPRPPLMSGAGQMDRRNEGAYLAEMRQIARDIELTAARQLRTFQREMGRMECDFRLTSELKWQLSRSKKETEILAGDDPVLQAKMAIIEDDQFQRMRAYVIDAFDD